MDFFKLKKLLLIILSFFVIMISSCNLINSDEKFDGNREGVYDGIYLQGIEDSWFVPCMKIDESWKPIFTETTFKPVSEVLIDNSSSKVFIRARGLLSKKGEYKGWFARYDREFEIKKIIKVRASDSEKCH